MLAWRVLALVVVMPLAGCSLVTRAGVALLYERAELAPSQIVRDLCYTAAPCAVAHRLDLYLPAAKDWPIVVFVHGGNWDSGSKDHRAGGADVYANIGRFYASHGIGMAVINYRLQPQALLRRLAFHGSALSGSSRPLLKRALTSSRTK